MVLVNVKLVLNIGSSGPPPLPDSCKLRNEKVQVLLCFSLSSLQYYHVGLEWDFFSICHIENHSVYVVQHSLVKVLNLSI